ncbi:fructose-1,6-bisphosphatase [Aeromicrobium flavum]|uniref:Fructose-1,6-bisphosphatase n=1 Tax=Aeromicrobium flavum TaxID=416568 RepID=A0A512HY41_9ACTN|nr:fructose-1,6-bisphosphatase [Aeromicrobium flavum]
MTPEDVALASELVVEAAALAARIRADGGLETRAKTSVSDVVTEADLAAEAHIVERLGRERPDDGLLGEEGTFREGASGRRWVIDPVDGTYNFSTDSDYWCSAVALAEGDRVLLGAVAHHATGTVVVGGPGVPTTRNGEPLPDIEDAELAGLGAATYAHPGFIGTGAGFDAWVRAAALPATIRMLGSGSMDLVGVATGRLGCWFQHSTPDWDWLPGTALVAGLGGSAERVEAHGLVWSIAGPPTAVRELGDAIRGVAA